MKLTSSNSTYITKQDLLIASMLIPFFSLIKKKNIIVLMRGDDMIPA